MKIYTKTGDGGTTALFGGTRVPKHHIRIQSYGTLDELNSWIGMLRDQEACGPYEDTLLRIQDRLFTAGAMLATDPEKAQLKNGKQRLQIPVLEAADVTYLEACIDQLEADLPPMTHFVLPGGHPAVSTCHIARTVCRRGERMTTLLNEHSPVSDTVLAYLNRLSDYLFVLSRSLSAATGSVERKWIPDTARE
ncbi:cob(I)yrinic acid a,c-diamide adenosyltransferase [Robiginitalea sp. SC105]|uniref:cob(I)yrinic acid a,c-diamide adenosyltransferase n=1 Tax=Robiginitalea sp. SC105 TaxID=2762332 RepID=UPI00163AD926|nr:cob(I)yrinic acid a,c-diamide adenosyltransferase [Robiginitalea sp. SC105]MBC2839999.1 cob(I)yrinic acid a,c-diamide adenosyltransferase [Robiginitalea sp. SC105]